MQWSSKQNVFQLTFSFSKRTSIYNEHSIFLIFKSKWQHKICILYRTVWKDFLNGICNTTNSKWRDWTNGKNVRKIKVWILCMDVIHGGWGWGALKLTSKGRFLSPILNFESPLTKSIIYICPTRNHCIAVRYFQ